MFRECTEAENRLIRECADDVLIYPELYAAARKSIVLPMVLGFGVGLGLGTLLSLALPVTGKLWIRLILMISVALMTEVAVCIWEIYIAGRSRKSPIPGSRYSVNGGTVVGYAKDSPSEAYLLIAEDDLWDAAGNPCCIEFLIPARDDIVMWERILLVCSDKGAYIPLKVTERTKPLISMHRPRYVGQTDWSRAARLPHPAALRLDPVSRPMYEAEAAAFAGSCRRIKNIRVRNWIVIVLLSLLLLFLLGLLWIGLIAGEIITEPSAAVTAAAALLAAWGAATCGIACGIRSGQARSLKKLRYKKKVLFLSVRDEVIANNVTRFIAVYEWINGKLTPVSYPVNGNVFLPKDIPYGTVIQKYSRVPESGQRDVNFFSLGE